MGSLATRMKNYEDVSRIYLTKRCPAIIRIDGKTFHNFTKGFRRPFDPLFMETMLQTAKFLCENITGCKLAYTQSDEISLLLTDYDATDTQPWFDNNLQKLVSISASMATLAFNKAFSEGCEKLLQSENASDAPYLSALAKAKSKGAIFDSRAFLLPKEEVCNYFIWRQQDATRNSILMVAQSRFPHEKLQGVKCDELQETLFTECGVNWNGYPPSQKRGTCTVKQTVTLPNGAVRRKWTADENTPVFTKDRAYIERFVYSASESLRSSERQ